jgi:hypothetical protein
MYKILYQSGGIYLTENSKTEIRVVRKEFKTKENAKIYAYRHLPTAAKGDFVVVPKSKLEPIKNNRRAIMELWASHL